MVAHAIARLVGSTSTGAALCASSNPNMRRSAPVAGETTSDCTRLRFLQRENGQSCSLARSAWPSAARIGVSGRGGCEDRKLEETKVFCDGKWAAKLPTYAAERTGKRTGESAISTLCMARRGCGHAGFTRSAGGRRALDPTAQRTCVACPAMPPQNSTETATGGLRLERLEPDGYGATLHDATTAGIGRRRVSAARGRAWPGAVAGGCWGPGLGSRAQGAPRAGNTDARDRASASAACTWVHAESCPRSQLLK